VSWLARKTYADGDRIEVAGVGVRLRVSGRARRVSLRVDMARGEVVAVAPTARRLGEAAAFANQRAAWIVERVGEAPPRPLLAPGQMIEVLGVAHRLRHAPGRPAFRPAIGADPASLTVGGDPTRFSGAVIRALKAEAKRVLIERTEAHATALAKPLPLVSLTDARSRWGSCRQPRSEGFGAGYEVGRIRYSWRLVLAPFEIADYVAAHECAHLVEANHSPRFWAVVHGLVGDHRPHRAWLREHGARLHAFGAE
jgi:predicted metal-dependent hydrolase